MPDGYMPMPELSAAKATERNQAYFPPVISEITPARSTRRRCRSISTQFQGSNSTSRGRPIIPTC